MEYPSNIYPNWLVARRETIYGPEYALAVEVRILGIRVWRSVRALHVCSGSTLLDQPWAYRPNKSQRTGVTWHRDANIIIKAIKHERRRRELRYETELEIRKNRKLERQGVSYFEPQFDKDGDNVLQRR